MIDQACAATVRALHAQQSATISSVTHVAACPSIAEINAWQDKNPLSQILNLLILDLRNL